MFGRAFCKEVKHAFDTAGPAMLMLSLPLPAAPLPQPLFVASDRNNPYNSPIQRANPNSRQGSMPARRRSEGRRRNPTRAANPG